MTGFDLQHEQPLGLEVTPQCAHTIDFESTPIFCEWSPFVHLHLSLQLCYKDGHVLCGEPNSDAFPHLWPIFS